MEHPSITLANLKLLQSLDDLQKAAGELVIEKGPLAVASGMSVKADTAANMKPLTANFEDG